MPFEALGWSVDPEAAGPKALALASLANLAPADPVASVTYVSHGNALVVAGPDAALAKRCAQSLAADLHVTLLAQEGAGSDGAYVAWSGSVSALHGHLGDFEATLANLRAGGREAKAQAQAKFDVVLDLSVRPLFAMAQPPQGYFRIKGVAEGRADPKSEAAVLEEMRAAVGEFEKPRYFTYRENLCAHSRSGIEGCTACIDVCSTRAIEPAGDKVRVDPHLCMGCGACATVCPSGAMGYQFPRAADRGAQFKQLLSVYRNAGGQDPCILFHGGGEGREFLSAIASNHGGIPSRVLPLEAWHVASVGLDLLLPAIAFGASQVAVLCTTRETPEYREALRGQMAIGQEILAALGYEGTHFALIEAQGPGEALAGLVAMQPAGSVQAPAAFLLPNDKRSAIEFAVEHLARHAPTPCEEIGLSAGAPFGEVVVDRDKCTMCLACAGACPESALMDGVDRPLLKFLERNCVQCGLCERTCPEQAIALRPRLLLTSAVREARVLNETQPFHCVSCGKAFGTRQMVEAMLGRLSGHPMFPGTGALKRLQMCADCRVVDMMSNQDEVSVLKL